MVSSFKQLRCNDSVLVEIGLLVLEKNTKID